VSTLERTSIPSVATKEAGNGSVVALDASYAVEVVLVGTAAILFHRWDDASVERKSKAAKGSQAKKSDDVESYVYRTIDGEIGIPSKNFKACLREAGRSLPDPRSPRKSARDLVQSAIQIEGVQLAGLPVVFPIPAPGWVQRIATPHWPADLAAHMSPPGVTNQCVAGALATWALMHPADPRWNHPAPLFGNAIDLFGVARAEGFQLDSHPTPGAMVVYGSAYGVFGHIATVRAVQGDRYEVVEQNFLGFNPQLEPHWATFDLRSVAWPDPAVMGFVVAPGVG